MGMILWVLLAASLGFADGGGHNHVPLRRCTAFVNGKQVSDGPCAPDEPEDFYVQSRGIRVKKQPGTKQPPYDAVKNGCEQKKQGVLCLYLGLYHQERNRKVDADKYFSLSCRYGESEACEKLKATSH